MANERTLLAWVRTSITLMGLGFVVARFGLVLRELGARQQGTPQGSSSAGIIGVALVMAGVLVAVLGVARFLRTRSQLDRDAFHSEIALQLLTIGILVAAGIALVVYLLLSQ